MSPGGINIMKKNIVKNIKSKVVIAISFAILSTFFTGCSNREINQTINTVDNVLNAIDSLSIENTENSEVAANYNNIDKNVNDLINNIVISDASNDDYDRDSYTSSSQYYKCNKGHEYTSIRKYGYYESEWYNKDNDTYMDPYTDEDVDFTNVDWDHIIPLHYVNQHGGSEWTDEEKKAFADNPSVGVNVNSSDNRAKSDKGPSEWLPDENKDDYCYTWLIIADKYNISISQDDMNTIISEINNSTDGLQLLTIYDNN